MATRIGVDIGGTFSDLVYYDEETGEVGVAKGSSTPAAPHEGVARVIGLGVPSGVVERAELFLHGSTVALNALLERRGSTVGLLTTAGFRDVLEIRRGERAAVNDVMWKAPPPLVPRRRRLEVRERILADGTIDIPLVAEDVESGLASFSDQDVDSIAVVYLNAYVRPDHELATERLLRELGFTGEIALSHRVSGEYREYERASTTAVDAYIRPRVARYLASLEERLHELGFDGSCLITTSGGGALFFSEAESRPSQTIQSGPVAGAVGAGELCRELGIGTAVTGDVGGTSFDTCLVTDYRPETTYQGVVDGMPIQTQWVDVHSVGSGGGSIAYTDAGGLLRVGPRSAGADPGPACYRRGGTEPTVTDAACVLGMLAFGELADGLSLDMDAAHGALEPLAETLDRSVEEVARGVLTIATASMADTIREVTLQRGKDPRDAALIAFGGAGPLFSTLLARELGMARIVVPPYAGNFSAWGLLVQDITRSQATTLVRPLGAEGLEEAGVALARLFSSLDDQSAGADSSWAAEREREAALDLRFSGQEYTLTVDVPLEEVTLAAGVAEIRSAFIAEYARTFGVELDDAVEIVSVRARARTPLPRWASRNDGAVPPAAAARSLSSFSFAREEWLDFSVVERRSLGEALAGPAIVLEPTTTTYVDAGFACRVDRSGALVLEWEEQ